MRPTNIIIKGLREEAELDQIDVAKALGISQQAYSSYERGRYDLPSRHLVPLAHLYRVNVEYLLGLTDYKETFDYLNKPFVDKISIGNLFSNLMLLDYNGRAAVLEFIEFQKAKAKQ